jgi:hypothetical protein
MDKVYIYVYIVKVWLNTRIIEVVPEELGKGVSAVTDTKLVSVRYYRGNESIISFQGVAKSYLFLCVPHGDT